MSVTHGARDWHVIRTRSVKMFYKCVCVIRKNNRNLDRGPKHVFGHMQENKSNFQGDYCFCTHKVSDSLKSIPSKLFAISEVQVFKLV